MIWKILFYISILFLFIINIFDYISQGQVKLSSEWSYIFGILIFLVSIFISGVLWGLSFKKKIFSEKDTNIVQIVFFSLIILFFVNSISSDIRQINGMPLLDMIINVSVASFISLIFILPFLLIGYIAIKKYKKKLNDFGNVDKPYLKIGVWAFLIYFISHFTGVFILKSDHLLIYNIFDYLLELSYIYTGIFLIGYGFNKKIFNQLFWKISSFIYAPVLIFAPFMVSISYADDTILSQVQSLFSYNILSLSCALFFLYALYEYAFTNKFFPSKNNLAK